MFYASQDCIVFIFGEGPADCQCRPKTPHINQRPTTGAIRVAKFLLVSCCSQQVSGASSWIILLGSLLGLVVPVIHMMGRGVGLAGSIGHTRGAFFFVWMLIAIGVTSLLSVVLSVRGLWGLRRK